MHTDFFTLGIKQLDLWPQPFTLAFTSTLRINDYKRRKPCDLIDLLGNRHPFLDILKANLSGIFGNNWARMRIPGRQLGTCFDLLTIGYLQGGTIGHFMSLALAPIVISNRDFTGTGNDDFFVLITGHIAHRSHETHDTSTLGFDLASCGCTRCCTAHMERPHGQLCSRFANRLRGNDAH